MKITWKRALSVLVIIGVLIAVSSTITGGQARASGSSGRLQSGGESLTDNYGRNLIAAEPYPVGSMRDSAERANLRERLVRLNDPHKIGFLYGLSSTGQVMAFWTIKGKPSSTGSQLSITQTVVDGAHTHSSGNVAVDAMGDDGTYGPEECQSQGVFAFTADANALVEWCGPWMYSDAPLKLTTQPLIVQTGAAPTSDAHLNTKP